LYISQRYYAVPVNQFDTYSVREVNIECTSDIVYPCYLFIDQATKCGIAIYDKFKRLITTLYIKKEDTESIVEYRSKLKGLINDLIIKYKIEKLFCENVYQGENFNTVSVLVSIKEMLADIAYERNIKYYAIDNKKWKSKIIKPEIQHLDLDEKGKIRKAVKDRYTYIDDEQDVIDAIGIALAVLFNEDSKPVELRLDKKLSIQHKVFLVNSPDEIYDNLLKEFKSKIHKLPIYTFDYDISLDFERNFKYVLTNYNVLAVSEIPYNRYYGQILLMNNIKPSDTQDKILIGSACRTHS